MNVGLTAVQVSVLAEILGSLSPHNVHKIVLERMDPFLDWSSTLRKPDRGYQEKINKAMAAEAEISTSLFHLFHDLVGVGNRRDPNLPGATEAAEEEENL